ncbi:hypothetical protein HYU07_00500 [Candidatus Woesearchaeota archaeon]|nr:hypothetical protein [Candidatus Woesearchaeota archaeon]
MKRQIKNELYIAKLLIMKEVNPYIIDNKNENGKCFADYCEGERVFSVVLPITESSSPLDHQKKTSGIKAGRVTPFFRNIRDLLVYMRYNAPENYIRCGLKLPDELDGVEGYVEPMFIDKRGNPQVNRRFSCEVVTYHELNHNQKNIAKDGLCVIVNHGLRNNEIKEMLHNRSL